MELTPPREGAGSYYIDRYTLFKAIQEGNAAAVRSRLVEGSAFVPEYSFKKTKDCALVRWIIKTIEDAEPRSMYGGPHPSKWFSLNCFQYACYTGQTSVAKVMLDFGLEPDRISFRIAYEKGNFDIIHLVVSERGGWAKYDKEVIPLACREGIDTIGELLDVDVKVGSDALLFACKRLDDLSVVQFLVSKGTEPTSEHLLAACKYGDLPLVQFLVSKGTKPDSEHLLAGCKYGDLPVVQFFEANGVKPTSNDFLHACGYGNLAVVRFLVSKGFQAGSEHLIEACKSYGDENTSTLRFLVSVIDQEALFEPNSSGETIWATAAAFYRFEFIQHLAAYGNRNIDLVSHNAWNGLSMSPLEVAFHAECEGNLDPGQVIDALIKSGANIDAVDADGKTMLHRAVDVVQDHSDNFNALHHSNAYHIDAINDMLGRYGADLEIRDNDGNTPFAYAYFRQHSRQQYRRVFSYATGPGELCFPVLFIYHGAKIDDEMFQKMTDIECEDCLEVASEIPYWASYADNEAALRFLGSTKERDWMGGTPLLNCLERGPVDADTVTKLLRYGADINARNNRRQSALEISLDRATELREYHRKRIVWVLLSQPEIFVTATDLFTSLDNFYDEGISQAILFKFVQQHASLFGDANPGNEA